MPPGLVGVLHPLCDTAGALNRPVPQGCLLCENGDGLHHGVTPGVSIHAVAVVFLSTCHPSQAYHRPIMFLVLVSHVSLLPSVPFMTPFTLLSPSCLGGIPVTCPDTTTNSISQVNLSLKHTSSFANVLRSIRSYAFLTLEDNIPRVRQQHNSDYREFMHI